MSLQFALVIRQFDNDMQNWNILLRKKEFNLTVI